MFSRKKKEQQSKPNTISLNELMSGAKQHQKNIGNGGKFEIGQARRKGKSNTVRLTKKEQKRIAEEQRKEDAKPFSIFSLSSIKRAIAKRVWARLSDKTKQDVQQQAIAKSMKNKPN